MIKLRNYIILIVFSVLMLVSVNAYASVIPDYDAIFTEIKSSYDDNQASGTYYFAEYVSSEDKYYCWISGEQLRIRSLPSFQTVDFNAVHVFAVDVYANGTYSIKWDNNTVIPSMHNDGVIVYSNADILTSDMKDVYFSATSSGVSNDTSDFDSDYSGETIKSEDGRLIRIILDPLFAFINWLTRFLPDLSSPVESNWLQEVIQIFNYAAWFFPHDVLYASWLSISSWMFVNLWFGLFQFVVRLFTLRI